MSWKDRLKRSITREESPAAEDRVAASSAPAPSADAPVEAILAHLCDRIAAIAEGKLRVDEIDPSAHLFDSGYVDSLGVVTFLLEVETTYGIRIEDVELLDQCSTLEAIADRIRSAA